MITISATLTEWLRHDDPAGYFYTGRTEESRMIRTDYIKQEIATLTGTIVCTLKCTYFLKEIDHDPARNQSKKKTRVLHA